jgi:rod shape determining protein RodA
MIKRRKRSFSEFGDLGDGKRKIRFDFVLLFMVIAISSFGVLIIYSATRETLPGGVTDPQSYLNKQLIGLAIGMVLFAALQFINYRKIRKFWWLAFIAGILLLVAVLIFGYEVYGSKSWIDLKFFSVQPSELSKIFMVVSLAAVMSKWRREKVYQVKFKKVAISFVMTLIFMALVLLEPDYGTALIYFIVYVGLLFLSGANFGYLLAVVGLTAGGFFAALKAGLIKQYQLERILVVLNPGATSEGASYNLFQSKLAIGSGGILGKGLFLGKQTNLSYVPEHHNDFIFSVVGEELGFIGALVVILVLGVIIWRCFHIALRSSDSFARLLGAGVGLIILSQVIINIGMTIGIMPVIGIPLPFLSSGGSSLISLLLGIGLVENIYLWREVRKDHEVAFQEFK